MRAAKTGKLRKSRETNKMFYLDVKRFQDIPFGEMSINIHPILQILGLIAFHENARSNGIAEAQKMFTRWNSERLSLLKSKLAKAQKGWCTKCERIVKGKNLTRLCIRKVMIKGNASSIEIHEMCTLCSLKAQDLHGKKENGHEYFVGRVFKIEDDFIEVLYNDDEMIHTIRIAEKPIVFYEMTEDHITSDMEKEFEIPPHIEIYEEVLHSDTYHSSGAGMKKIKKRIRLQVGMKRFDLP